MSDLIDRHVAIELIRNLYPSAPIMPMNRKRWEEKYKPYIESEKALEQLPSVQQWIPCSERLPELGGAYLVTGKRKYPYDKKWEYFTDLAYNYGTYIDNYWNTCNDWDEGQEIHIIAWIAWAELPGPWKGEDE